MRGVEADGGYRAGAEVLCAACYFVLWGPAARAEAEGDEGRRAISRRPSKWRARWVTGWWQRD